MKQIILPFDGFYATLHGEAIENDHEGRLEDEPGIKLDYNKAHELYARAYVDAFSVAMRQRINGQWCDLNFKFHKLESPREYNFHNDVIVVEASDVLINIMMARVNWQELTDLVRKQLTPYDGFIPFYSADIGDWSNWTQWGEVQLGLALQSWVDTELSEGWQYNHLDIRVNEAIEDAYSSQETGEHHDCAN